MGTCEQFREQVWDELFGLLEPGDSAPLHRHLITCHACQEEMTMARAQHRLLAEAARLAIDVPLFTPPEADGAVPFSRPARSGSRSGSRRLGGLPWLATAAAVLLAIGLPFGIYAYGRHHYEAASQAAAAS